MSAILPEGYQTVTPYLILPGAAAFIEFVTKVFNAELIGKHMRDENIIMHAELKIGNSSIMLAEATEQFAAQPSGFFIYVGDADSAYINALNNGAVAVTPVENQSYGRSGGVKDAFGNTWWITSPL